MIITIPITIPDEILENTIAKDYESKITENLTNEVRKILAEHDPTYYYRNGKDPHRGLESIVYKRIDMIIETYKDDIIEATAIKLAERLSKTKKAKELLNE